jgi:hypothetical protein
MGAVQLPRERLQLGLGDQRVAVVVGAPHPVGNRGPNVVRELVGDVAQLVQLAALHDRMVEHILDRAAQGLGAVDHHQDRAGDIQAPVTQPGEQVGDHGGVLGRALDQPERDLGPVDGDGERDHAAMAGNMHAVDHERDDVQPGQVPGEQLGQGMLGRGHEPTGDRRLGRGARGPLAVRSTAVPTGSSPAG